MRLTTYSGDKPYIFISYAHHDSEVVFPILEALQNSGFRLWFDQGIEAGTEWPEYIAEHLGKADKVIAFMSKSAAESRNCRREINYAIELKKEPLVIYLEEVELSAGMKLQLNTSQAMFKYHSASDEEFKNELCKAKFLQNCRDEQTEPTETPTAQPQPQYQPVTEAAASPAQKPKSNSSKIIIGIVAGVLAFLVAFFLVSGLTSGGSGDSNGGSNTVSYSKDGVIVLSDTGKSTYTNGAEVYYNKSTGIVTELVLNISLDVSEDEEWADESARESLVEDSLSYMELDIEGLAFAEITAEYDDNFIYFKYKFEDLDLNNVAKLFNEDFVGDTEMCKDADGGDYTMDYSAVVADLKADGLTEVK